MIKKIIILIVMGLTLSSCQLFTEAIKDNIYRVERERKELSKKDGPSAIVVDEYKEGVKAAIKDILKRPINKKVQFEGATFIIPENTRINPKHGNIVDEKTGYGIAVIFYIEDYCTDVFYRKKIEENKYIMLFYNHRDKSLDTIAQKVIKANGFTNTCK